METIFEVYRGAKKRLALAGVDDPAFDAACIFEKHTGLRRQDIIVRKNESPACCLDGFWTDIARRERREPLQYICGTWSFYGLDFFVGKGVLIPRQDTEFLAAEAIGYLKSKNPASILELCAGSGCVTTAVLKNTPGSCGVCVELSDDALFFLKKNLEQHRLSGLVKVIKADILAPSCCKTVGGDFDALICNPPYIKSGDITVLEPEVAKYEPRMALDGGDDGLTFYRSMKDYLPLLKDGGLAAFEVGMGQANDVASLLSGFGLKEVFIKKDYQDIGRVVGGLWRTKK